MSCKTCIVLVCFICVSTSVAWADWRPPLAESERAQLETAGDFTNQIDEGALYPLLRNALQWDQSPPVPDYMELQLHPDRFRGELFTLTGIFGQARDGVTLARPGPWGEQINEWLVVVREQQQLENRTIPQEVAIVLIVDPQGELTPPREGQQVRFPAIFYKMLRTRLAGSDEHADFPVFVAAPGMGGAPPTVQAAQTQDMTLQSLSPYILILVIACFALYIFVRHWSKRSQIRDHNPRAILAARRAAAKREQAQEAETDEQDDEEDIGDLPEDPVQAMETLRQRIQNNQEPRE